MMIGLFDFGLLPRGVIGYNRCILSFTPHSKRASEG